MKTRIISIKHFLESRIKTSQSFINNDKVKEYKIQIDKGNYPIITVSKGYIIDGNHRLKAYIESKAKNVKVNFLNNKDLTKFLFKR